VPERCCAGTGALAVFSLSGVSEGEYWIHMDIHEGSYGGRATKDGMEAMDTLFTNTRCAPIEEIETEFPLRCRRWELNDDPVGHGRFRGGKGGIRDWEYLSGGYFSSEADGHLVSPWGLLGGQEGAPAQMWLNPDDPATAEKLSSKQPGRSAEIGNIFRAVAPNGGGFGDPLERDPERVLGDWLDEIVTLEEAEQVYGVLIDAEAGRVKEAETETRRGEMAGET